MQKDLTQGNVIRTMLLFAGPMILGNMLQQFYNIADTLIVGRFLGADALAAVGSAYTLMTFLTSILIGLSMGSGSVFSFYFGKGNRRHMKNSMWISAVFIGVVSVALNILVFVFLKPILIFLRIPSELMEMMTEYTWIVFIGMFFVFVYNFFAYLLRAIGNSVVPLYFLGGSSVMNIILDLLFIIRFHMGIAGAAWATVIAQALAGGGIAVYTWAKEPSLRPKREEIGFSAADVREVVYFSFVAAIQQSVMNFGILMIQGLVNGFGTAVMAAFAAGVKIDTVAYMPSQEFSNAFSLFISQNHGAGKQERVQQGVRSAIRVSVLVCVLISLIVFFAAKYLMMIFIDPSEAEIIHIGVDYLRVEGACYCGIGILFLLYGYYRGIGRPEMSLVLTIISLGTRVLLAYMLAPVPAVGVWGIWWAIPIGWLLADTTGIVYMKIKC